MEGRARLAIEKLKSLFYQSRSGDAKASQQIAYHFFEGTNGFPIDLIQAQRYFLKAIVTSKKQIQTIPQKEIQEYLSREVIGSNEAILLKFIELKYKESEEQGFRLLPSTKLQFDVMEVINEDYDLKTAEEKLKAVEKFGPSEFEKSLISLKTICTKYIATHANLFQKRNLPMELENEIVASQVKNTNASF